MTSLDHRDRLAHFYRVYMTPFLFLARCFYLLERSEFNYTMHSLYGHNACLIKVLPSKWSLYRKYLQRVVNNVGKQLYIHAKNCFLSY